MAHARHSRFQRNGARRRVSWSLGPSGTTGVLSATGTSIFPVAAQALTDDLTLVRTRGRLLVQLITATASGGFQWAFGMCNVTENAAGIGVTAVPDPLDDIAWDGWFVYETGQQISVDASPSEGAEGSQLFIVIDSKAMRKTHDTDVIVAVFAVTEVGTATMEANLMTRLLDKLP